MIKSVTFCCLFFFLFPLEALRALNQERTITQYSVRVWDMEAGLPGNSVLVIRQTKDGYLWIGTPDGLLRFDGNNFELFTTGNIPQLKSNVIRALYEDREGTLWIGTYYGGLTSFKQGIFTTYPVTGQGALYKIVAIEEDRWGNLWIGSITGGLACLHIENGKFSTYTTTEGLPDNRVVSIYKDARGELWVTTDSEIVKIVNPGIFQACGIQQVLPYPKTVCLYEVETGSLWIGTGNRSLFRRKDNQFNHFGAGAGVPHRTITCLYKDSKANFWIGTDGGGVTLMRNGKLSTLPGGDGLASGSVSSIYEDREGSIWVGTLDGGLHRIRDSKFTTYTGREGLSHEYVQCLYETSTSDILIGTKGGLNVLRSKNNEVTTLLTTEEGLLNNSVTCLYEEISGCLWIGTWGGLHWFRNGRLTNITKKNGLSDNRIHCIYRDSQGNTWVGTGNGLNRFDSNSTTCTIFTTKQELNGNHIEFIFEDSSGNLLIGTDAGLNQIDNDAVTSYKHATIVGKNFFRCAYEDKEGTLWFGTDSGLVRLQEKETVPKRTTYDVQSGLIENDIYSILEDSRGYLWLTGQNGSSRILKSDLEDFSRGTIKRIRPDSYNEKDGMKSRWCTGTGLRTRDGRFWFPTALGITTIDPDNIKKNIIPPPLIIEKFMVDGELIHSDDNAGESNSLELAQGKTRLSFYYTAVSFVDPGRIEFKVRLIGYDNDWIDMGNNRNITYTGVSPGHYTFWVTAANPDGVWNEKGVSSSFYLKPYFYQTTWFYFSVILFIFLAAFSFYHLRVGQLRKKQKELATLVELRTHDLKERNTELEKTRQKIQQSKELIEVQNRQLHEQSEKLKELDKAKSRFFTNISHEFRTPLTLINGPLEQILKENPDKKLETKAKMMLRNSRRLLDLVNQLLELAKLDSGKMKLQAVLQNIVPFARNIVMCFDSLAWQNKVELTFQTETDEIPLYFDPEKLERVIINLLSNAFNFTPPGGKIGVMIQAAARAAYPQGCVEILVRDSGIEIPAAQLPYIFDRFYQGESSYEYKHKGTGIGLALSKELVELHHGEIQVRSSSWPDQRPGTEFLIYLPAGNAHLQPSEILESSPMNTMHPRFGTIPVHDESIDMNTTPVRQKETEDEETNGAENRPAKQEKQIILVVDDSTDMRTYMRSALEPHFSVIEAENGNEGIQKAGMIIPDLVISDIMMPEVDGYELCARLKKDIKTSHIPVILLTAKASEQSIAEGLETGADDYITKPFNIDLLVIRVRNLIRLRRQLQQRIQQNLMLQPGDISVSSIDAQFIKEIQTILNKNFSDPDFSVKQLAEKLFISSTHLRRKVEALTGEPPNNLIRSYRLTRGAQLLKANFGNVTEVAFAVGFSSTSYFTKCFKEKFNQLPHSYEND